MVGGSQAGGGFRTYRREDRPAASVERLVTQLPPAGTRTVTAAQWWVLVVDMCAGMCRRKSASRGALERDNPNSL